MLWHLDVLGVKGFLIRLAALAALGVIKIRERFRRKSYRVSGSLNHVRKKLDGQVVEIWVIETLNHSALGHVLGKIKIRRRRREVIGRAGQEAAFHRLVRRKIEVVILGRPPRTFLGAEMESAGFLVHVAALASTAHVLLDKIVPVLL